MPAVRAPRLRSDRRRRSPLVVGPVELFVRREDAERFVKEVQADDGELAGKLLRLEPLELDG